MISQKHQKNKTKQNPLKHPEFPDGTVTFVAWADVVEWFWSLAGSFCMLWEWGKKKKKKTTIKGTWEFPVLHQVVPSRSLVLGSFSGLQAMLCPHLSQHLACYLAHFSCPSQIFLLPFIWGFMLLIFLKSQSKPIHLFPLYFLSYPSSRKKRKSLFTFC